MTEAEQTNKELSQGETPAISDYVGRFVRMREILLFVFFPLAGFTAALAPRGLIWLVIAFGLVALPLLFSGDDKYVIPPKRPSNADMPWHWVTLVILFIWAAFSASWASVPKDSMEKLLQLGILGAGGISLLLATRMLPPNKAERSMFHMTIGIGLGIVIMMADASMNFPLYRLFNGISHSAFVKQNVINLNLAALSVLAWIPAAWMALKGKFAWAQFWSALVTLIFFRLESQSALIAWIAGLIIVILSHWRAKVSMVVTAVALPTIMLATIPAIDLMYKLGWTHAQWLNINHRHRVEIWQVAMEQWQASPWKGLGLEAARNLPRGDFVSQFTADSDKLLPLHPHNATLNILLDLGIIGAFIVAAFLVILALRSQKLPQQVSGYALAALMAAFTAAQTSYGIWQGWWVSVFWIGAIALLACGRACGTKTAEKEPPATQE